MIPLPPLHQLGIFVRQVHAAKTLVLSEVVHGMLDALPQSLSTLKLRREPGWWRVTASFVLCFQVLNGPLRLGQQSLEPGCIKGSISGRVGCNLGAVQGLHR